MFFIAESIQSFSGIIFFAPKIGDISSHGLPKIVTLEYYICKKQFSELKVIR